LKTFRKNDFSDGISRFIQFLPELVIDVPLISKYLFTFVIKPLMDNNMLDLRYIKWSMEPEKKGDDEDDIVFDGSDSYFKLMAYILLDQFKKCTSWKDTVKYYNERNWKTVSQAKHDKIEDTDELWD